MRLRPILIGTVTASAVSLLAAGCGGGSSPGVAGITTSTTHATTTVHAGLLAYSRCMRSHGLPTFPDPTSGQGIPKDEMPLGNPRFPSASNACQYAMPADGLGPQQSAQQTSTRVADELSFAKCMRSHGVTRFPDPTPQGELSIASVQAQGIDLHSPSVLRVVATCLPASHGALTPARVGQALRDVSG